MEKDEILAEVWRHRDAFARRHRYDLESMVAELRRRERRPLSALVDRSKDTPGRRLHPAGRRQPVRGVGGE